MSGYALPRGKIMATGAIIILTVTIFATLVSRRMVRGLTMGATKEHPDPMSATMSIPFGVSLFFRVRRRVAPEPRAALARDAPGLDPVRFSVDLIDPAWPAALLAGLAEDPKTVTRRHDVTIHGAFIDAARRSVTPPKPAFA